MRIHISNTLSSLDQERVVKGQVKWEFLKYEIRKFAKKFFKTISCDARIERKRSEHE